MAKDTIHINPKNKGKFIATKKATGKSTEELTHSKNPLTRKRAIFALMAKRKWKPLKENKVIKKLTEEDIQNIINNVLNKIL